jgi:hypothetical protein
MYCRPGSRSNSTPSIDHLIVRWGLLGQGVATDRISSLYTMPLPHTGRRCGSPRRMSFTLSVTPSFA